MLWASNAKGAIHGAELGWEKQERDLGFRVPLALEALAGVAHPQ
jgi:hypothetical protein